MARRSSNLWAYLLVCIALPLVVLPGNGPRKTRLIKDAKISPVSSTDSSRSKVGCLIVGFFIVGLVILFCLLLLART
jgi:hypothetical protein